MNKINQIEVKTGAFRRTATKAALLLGVSALVTGCYFTPAALRDYARPGGTTPWWCKGTPDL